jgi:hypothetical protein
MFALGRCSPLPAFTAPAANRLLQGEGFFEHSKWSRFEKADLQGSKLLPFKLNYSKFTGANAISVSEKLSPAAVKS